MIKLAEDPGMKTVSKPSRPGKTRRGCFPLLDASSSSSSSSGIDFGICRLNIFTNRSAVSLLPAIGAWKG